MWNLIAIVTIIAVPVLLVLAVIGLFKKNDTALKRFVGALISLLIAIVAIVNASPSTETSSMKTPKNNEIISLEDKKKEDAAKAKEKAKNQQAVIAFEKSIYTIESTAKPALDNYQSVMKNLGKKTSIYDAYGAANNAKVAVSRINSRLMELSIPDNLPEDMKGSLEEVKSDLEIAYSSKENAFDYAMKFLDEQKPSYMQQFKDEMANADQYIISGIAKLFDVKAKLGIEITKKAKK